MWRTPRIVGTTNSALDEVEEPSLLRHFTANFVKNESRSIGSTGFKESDHQTGIEQRDARHCGWSYGNSLHLNNSRNFNRSQSRSSETTYQSKILDVAHN